MSYSLDLHLEPGVRRHRILQHFATRQHFTVVDDDALYENPDTGVSFVMKLRCTKRILLQRNVAAIAFEVNFFRPRYFGLEAEREMSVFAAAFHPRFEDSQIHGMGEGPYSSEGFLSGWNFGNLFSVRSALAGNPDLNIATLPEEDLRAAWTWNYQRAERSERLKHRRFVPSIMFFLVEGRPSRVVVWPLGMPVSLPRVDYVLVGRTVSQEKRFGLARWSEVEEVVKRAHLCTAEDPLDLEYFITPPPIANWVRTIPLIERDALTRLRPDQILDHELIAAARESMGKASIGL